MPKIRSLNASVYECLNKHSPESAKKWKTQCPSTSGDPTEEQLEKANSFWKRQLGSLRTNTIAQRCHLHNETDVTTWMDNFERYIVPIIVKHRLPL